MNLEDYMKSIPYGTKGAEIERIAKAMNVSEMAVNHWISGYRQIAPEKVLKLEKVLNGKVSRHKLRPDIYPL